MTVVFLGLSHLGIVASIGWAASAPDVVGLDPDTERVAALERRELPAGEPGLADGLEAAGRRLCFTSDPGALEAAELVFVSWDVETDAEDRTDLAGLERRLDVAIERLRDGVVLVLMSQVPVGYTRALEGRIRSRRPDLSFQLVYMVETLVIGQALDRFLHPERFILGLPEDRAAVPPVLAQALSRYDCPVLTMRFESAELCKMAINLYLASSVTFANTVSDLCEALGADMEQIAGALRLDRRIGPHAYLRPGLGIAGGNLERDLSNLLGLAGQAGVVVPLVETIVAENRRRGEWLAALLERELFSRVAAPRIGIWGLAYKLGSDSLKNAPAISLLDRFEGRATFAAHDPRVRELPGRAQVALCEQPVGAAAAADCLVVLTAWPEYREVDLAQVANAMSSPLVVDCCGGLPGTVSPGLRVLRMGRG